MIRNGFAPGWEHDYEGLIYASFQERATRITHGNVGKLAAAQGDDNLALICRKIAADETRHETFYTRVIGQVMDQDPHGGMLAYKAMLKGKIAMPGRLMFDGKDPDLFDHFGAVTQRNGVYTFQDYGHIITHLNDAWDIAHRPVRGEAAKAQEYICRQPERYTRLAGEIADRLAEQPRAVSPGSMAGKSNATDGHAGIPSSTAGCSVTSGASLVGCLGGIRTLRFLLASARRTICGSQSSRKRTFPRSMASRGRCVSWSGF